MGVVRDVTIDQLTQAVQGISTSGMSDSTGQAINSTLGTLGKDTSLQDIKNAINSLANTISPSATNVAYNNTGTGLTASNVQSAITELHTVTTSTTGTGGFTLRKINNIVELKGNGVTANQLGTIPSDFRPVSSSYLTVATIGDGANHYYNGYLFVNSATGEVEAFYLNNGTSTRVTTSSWKIYITAHYVL